MRTSVIFSFLLFLVAAAVAQPATQADEAAVVDPKSVTFDSSVSSHVDVRKTVTGHLLVPAKVNGKDAGWFILDTGAGISCIDKQVADELKLESAGGITARGMGGDRESNLRKFTSLSVGPVRVDEGVMLELNLKPYAMLMGDKIAGIIGHECFDGGVFDIDFGHAKVAIFDPGKYQLDNNDGKWSDMRIIRRRPAVQGNIEGSDAGWFVLDTGSNEALLVHAPAVKKLNLMEGRKTSTSVAGGVGGMKKVRHGKLKDATIGGCEVKNISATFAEATDGVTADEDTLATAGVALLEKFRVIVNQPEKKIAFQRVVSGDPTTPSTQPGK